MRKREWILTALAGAFLCQGCVAPPAPVAAPPRDELLGGEPLSVVPPPKPPSGPVCELGLPRDCDGKTPLTLERVLDSVERHFPLLLAIEMERDVAGGQRLAVQGAFDLNLRARGWRQHGTFPSSRLDVSMEQATPFYGLSFLSGYRFGFEDFPVYYGERKTADGGEMRAGLLLPLLRDGPIDRRRAAVFQAEIQQNLAEPIIQRARLDYLRAAARAYWNWVAAGEQHRIAAALLRLARERQAGLEEQLKKGQTTEFVVVDNSRLIAEREGAVIAADRRRQQTAFELSLFSRDAHGDPCVPNPAQLPQGFAQETPPQVAQDEPAALTVAYNQRPELRRFALAKDRVRVDLDLARNQTLPGLSASVFGSQDIGKGKKGEGQFALDRRVAEGSLIFDVPLQRREAQGRMRVAETQLAQLSAQEQFARDSITAEVRDALNNLERTLQRLARAREEFRIAQRVADLERARFRLGQSTLLEVNLRELAAAGAESKVIDTLADYFRALAEYRAAVALDVPPPK